MIGDDDRVPRRSSHLETTFVVKLRGTDRTERTTLFEGDDIDVTDEHTAQALDELERLEEYLNRRVYDRLERALAVYDHIHR